MPSKQEQFWEQRAYAFVGHSARKPFPKISYGKARRQGKRVFPVDPSTPEILGDRTFADLAALPEKVDGVVIEVPPEETASWVARAAAAGVKQVWIHDGCDTPEALEVARREGVEALTGHCAVMYLARGFSPHTIHRWFVKRAGEY